ncbi:MAG: hypothetical protein KC421_14130 [Anaerolineales bacterium]|nr:hypothetical protein [Anaerolineales bacterium]
MSRQNLKGWIISLGRQSDEPEWDALFPNQTATMYHPVENDPNIIEMYPSDHPNPQGALVPAGPDNMTINTGLRILADLIEEGSKHHPQSHYGFVQRTKPSIIFPKGGYATSALAAAYVAANGIHTFRPDISIAFIAPVLLRATGINVATLTTPSPWMHLDYLANHIMVLNDQFQWRREDIALWLRNELAPQYQPARYIS